MLLSRCWHRHSFAESAVHCFLLMRRIFRRALSWIALAMGLPQRRHVTEDCIPGRFLLLGASRSRATDRVRVGCGTERIAEASRIYNLPLDLSTIRFFLRLLPLAQIGQKILVHLHVLRLDALEISALECRRFSAPRVFQPPLDPGDEAHGVFHFCTEFTGPTTAGSKSSLVSIDFAVMMSVVQNSRFRSHLVDPARVDPVNLLFISL